LLSRLSDQIAEQLESVGPAVRNAIEEQQPEEARRIDERRAVIRDEYLPKRQCAADELLATAQAETAELRALNPELDRREEDLKQQKAQFEAQLASLNDDIGRLSRGLGIVTRFLAISKADRERQRLIGRLEVTNNALLQVRQEWQTEKEVRAIEQTQLQERWQLESIAVARLQAELDQLDDDSRRQTLVFRRAIRHVLDSLKVPSRCPDPDLDASLREMVELNIETDSYQDGLASVGGLIGLLRGIHSGMEAIRRSVQGLADEQSMHSAYLQPLSFDLPVGVHKFHSQWAELGQQFVDEQTIGDHPADFAAAVAPLLEGQLSQSRVESMFEELGRAITEATAAW
jgi:hypothetical protein